MKMVEYYTVRRYTCGLAASAIVGSAFQQMMLVPAGEPVPIMHLWTSRFVE